MGSRIVFAGALLMALSQPGKAQAPTADPADVSSIADIVRAAGAAGMAGEVAVLLL